VTQCRDEGAAADPRRDPVPGLGIDLIEIDRVESALRRRPRLADRLFRPGELEACRGRARPGRHLAARFAAKEAAIKALGGGCSPRDVEVAGDPVPELHLHGRAAERADRNGIALSVSMTHSRGAAAAVVVARPVGS
jgi:holo-[acyl-carrier protein] synthase